MMLRGLAAILLAAGSGDGIDAARYTRALGKIGIMIYANHAVRAAVTAMRDIFAAIRRDGGIHEVDKRLVTVEDIFELQRVPAMKAAEKRYLR